ncbi:MAG: sel1 repeat family protein, partial [Oscillospiraceae bacterium]|nr:sel1 repeat family protein [Oscillospiraceae bacterium]
MTDNRNEKIISVIIDDFFWGEEIETAEGLTELGLYYRDRKNGEKAYECFDKAARLGGVDAVFYIGKIHYECGRPDSMEVAYKCFRKTSKKGHSEATYYLGLMTCKGEGTEKNTALGIEILEEAAKKGSLSAMFKLGEFYHTGEYVDKDDKLALFWTKKAVDKGSIGAMVILSEIYSHG